MILVYEVKRDFDIDQQLVTRWTDEKMAIEDCALRNKEQAVLEKYYKYVIVKKRE
jgi:hypothetical protein